MAEIVAIANQKGGVGKTTTSINLAVALAAFDYETLLIDFDPQSNATSGLGVDITKNNKNIYDVLCGKAPIESAIHQTSVEWLDIVPTSHNLAGAEIELVSEFSRESVLKRSLAKIGDMYKFIIIDCPPSLGLLTVNALNSSNSVITPVQCEFYAMEGLAYFMNTVEKIRQALNPGLKIDGGVITMYDSRINLANQVKGEIGKYYGDRLYKTVIPRNVRLAEAPSFGQSIFVYDPSSRGALAYKELALEFLARRGVDISAYNKSDLYVTEESELEYDLGG
ncbi:MAG: chromosome partitioning protein [Elusimicrobia bacterium GWA2_61_42]|nr:MAG: chromosome partitioning protein [Elusimicrobia bacterium GWA2_61_42]OGR77278.1 MAG: chromosome partitioning protein [Elusimicrobia bacterium GWC2_61_25]